MILASLGCAKSQGAAVRVSAPVAISESHFRSVYVNSMTALVPFNRLLVAGSYLVEYPQEPDRLGPTFA